MEHSGTISEELLTRIDDYLMRHMTNETRIAFEQEMAANNNLAKQVNEIKLLKIGIAEKNLAQQLVSFHQGTQTKHISFNNKWWAVAASIIIIAGTAIFFFNRQSPAEQLFAKYYTADPGLITTMGATDEYDFDKAMVDYKTGNYGKAASEWERLLQFKEASDTLLYFTATAFLANKEPKRAIPYYEKVIANKNSSFNDDAHWYLGLALIKEKKYTAAISWIEKSNNPNKESLLTLLKDHAPN